MRATTGALRFQSLFATLLAAGFTAAARAEGVLDPQGPIAAAERELLLNATAIMLVVVVPVIVLTLAFAWWYRASNTRAAYQPNWAHSGRIELVVWSIPAMVVLLFLHIGTDSDHTNSVLALVFGVIIVALVVAGSLWIMAHLNANMLTPSQMMDMQR